MLLILTWVPASTGMTMAVALVVVFAAVFGVGGVRGQVIKFGHLPGEPLNRQAAPRRTPGSTLTAVSAIPSSLR